LAVSTTVIRLCLAIAPLVLAGCGDATPPEKPTADLAGGVESIASDSDLSPPPEAASTTPRGEPAESPRRGLWVLCEGSQRILEHPERFPELIEDAQRLAASDLFVQVYRGGRSWFDSSLADATPHRAIVESTGRDTFAELIPLAQAAGLRVHAWVNVLSLAGNTDSQFVLDLGRGVVAVDRKGRSVLDYPKLEIPNPDRAYYRMGTPAVWLDPAAPGVAEHIAAIFAELPIRYPTLDGIHLDYIRYPDVLPFVPGSRFGVGLDFGYGEATRARFQAETGLTAPFDESLANANRWDAWRRAKLTELVATIGGAVHAVAPDLALSAAVWAYADRAYLALGQDWRGWLDADLIHFAVPMAYTLDDALLSHLAHAFAGVPSGDRIWIGLGSWLFEKKPERAVAQVEIVRAAGAGGDALFSWDSIAAAPALRDALAGGASDAP
jgi:uncharacterized lipoprotein YddW (UPF0748 family)